MSYGWLILAPHNTCRCIYCTPQSVDINMKYFVVCLLDPGVIVKYIIESKQNMSFFYEVLFCILLHND